MAPQKINKIQKKLSNQEKESKHTGKLAQLTQATTQLTKQPARYPSSFNGTW